MITLRYVIALLFTCTYLLGAVDINNATAEELLELNGIGKTKAAKIIQYREANQCFQSIDELANIDGISEKLLAKNRVDIVLGKCEKSMQQSVTENAHALKNVLLDPVNLIFVVIIVILAIIDQKTKKDFKSQIVSVGVLGTFVGIFIGLQNFNPEDIINSVNDILIGLKTAFFTSIVGMSVATILSIAEKLRQDTESK